MKRYGIIHIHHNGIDISDFKCDKKPDLKNKKDRAKIIKALRINFNESEGDGLEIRDIEDREMIEVYLV